jgi:hypothetical protein
MFKGVKKRKGRNYRMSTWLKVDVKVLHVQNRLPIVVQPYIYVKNRRPTRGGSWEVVKPTTTTRLKMEDVCIFYNMIETF